MAGLSSSMLLAVLFPLLGLLSSLVQAQTVNMCKGYSANGDAECTVTPHSTTPWKYTVPGPIEATAWYDSADAAVDAYKAVITRHNFALCGGVSSSVDGSDPTLPPGNWNFRRMYMAERFVATFRYSRQSGSGTTNDPFSCQPMVITTYLYRSRTPSCDTAKGWSMVDESPTALCMLPARYEDRSCPTSNPVLPGSGVKLLSSNDYVGVGAHPLQFSRTFRSRWARAELRSSMGGIANSSGHIGWLHSYERQIAEVSSAPSSMRRAVRPDGSSNTFTLTTDARGIVQWMAEPGLHDRLSANATGWEYKVFAEDVVERYDPSGRLLSIADRNGRITTLFYSDAGTPVDVAPKAGLLIRVTNHFGRSLKFGYEQNGKLATLIDPEGGVVRYGYDGFGNLTGATWQDSSYRAYRHEDSRFPGHITGITGEDSIRYSTYSYDSEGRVAASELAGGFERLVFGYGPSGTTSTIHDGTGSGKSYQFSNKAGVVRPTYVSSSCTGCGSAARITSYDSNLFKVKDVWHDGTVTFYVHDASGRETERATFDSIYAYDAIRPALSFARNVISTEWHPTWRLPTQTAEPGKITAYTYDSKGNLTGQSWTATTDTTGRLKFSATKTGTTYATGWSYNANSLPTTIVRRETPAGSTAATETNRWTLAYNALGDLTRITEPASGKVATGSAYDAHGALLHGTDLDGAPVRFTYSPRGYLLTSQYGDAITTYTRNQIGMLTSMSSPSTSLQVTYDSTQRMTALATEVRFPSTTSQAFEQKWFALRRWLNDRALAVFPAAYAQENVAVPVPVPFWSPFGPRPDRANRGAWDDLAGPRPLTYAEQCAAVINQALSNVLSAVGSLTQAESCQQDSQQPGSKDCEDRCKRATAKARSIYYDLVTKSIPQYLTGGRWGSDSGHYQKITERQNGLRDAIRKVRLYCNPLPSELAEWERVANLAVPLQH